jgi:hypothetical protein
VFGGRLPESGQSIPGAIRPGWVGSREPLKRPE